MAKRAGNASLDRSSKIQKNPEQRLESEVVKALSARRAALSGILSLRNQNDLSSAERKKFSKARRESYQAAAGSIGVDLDKLNGLRVEKNSHIADTLKRRHDKLKNFPTLKPGDLIFPKPGPTDPNFWSAETFPSVAPDTTATFQSDGLHFTGGPKVNNYDGEMHASFGAVGTFVLQPNRRPSSASDRFRSSPHVEIFGGVVAFAPDWDPIQGDGIASCNLFLRQTVFQLGFGQTGPVQQTVAEALNDNSWEIYLKNTGYSRHADMPGFTWVPPVSFNTSQFRGNENLFAEIEVRFDIYLNTEGALLWCDPDVLLRMFQWPLDAA